MAMISATRYGKIRMKKKATGSRYMLPPREYITGTADRDRAAVSGASRGCVGTTTVKSRTHPATHERPKSLDPISYMIGATMSWYSEAAIP